MPKLGWSMYASPVTMMTSHESQPSASISARVVGNTGAVPKRSAQYLRRANSVAGTNSGETGRNSVAVLVISMTRTRRTLPYR